MGFELVSKSVTLTYNGTLKMVHLAVTATWHLWLPWNMHGKDGALVDSVFCPSWVWMTSNSWCVLSLQ